ncbi:MAG: acetyl-CoA carboxylase, carboxyltransferase subunit beta [Candidatus Dormibacteria bacterium]
MTITAVKPCPRCGECHTPPAIAASLACCPGCGHHYRLGWRERVDQLLDGGRIDEWDRELRPSDPLEFVDLVPYVDRIRAAEAATGLRDAVVTGSGEIEGRAVGLAVMDFGYIGGSMGQVVGERVARAMERSAARAVPFIAITASGGARMQEGILSLMQMAKTSIARSRLAEVPVPYISILTHPTMGGVMASFAASADIILAEPGATIGFAGERVITQATHEQVPHGFQTSEFMLEHGFVDRVVDRRDLRQSLSRLLAFYKVARSQGISSEARA